MRKVLHFDGDSFFASIEQALDYRLKGKPVVTGGERGAITSASTEAKKAGIHRGIPMKLAKELCPELVIVPGNYLAYSIFAQRMYRIVREFSDEVEEYSIDECFADITGLDKRFGKNYEEVALMIKDRLETSLGVTFGAGLGPTKVLAKVASKHRKPGGFTVIDKTNHLEFLKNLSVGDIWGVGPSSMRMLRGIGVRSGLDLAQKPLEWLKANRIPKQLIEIWWELRGLSVKDLSLDHEDSQSIIVSRTFYPPSAKKELLLSQLSKNAEAACAKARRAGMRPKAFRFYLKTQEFAYSGLEFSLIQATSSPNEIIKIISESLGKIYRSRIPYRATGIVLKGFVPDRPALDLFGESAATEKHRAVFSAVDKLAKRYGEGAVHLASSLSARRRSGKGTGKSLDIPFLGTSR